MWLYVIAFNLLVLLWGIVVVLGLSVAIAIVGTLLVALALATMFVLKRRAAKKGAEGIEKALDQQASEQSSSVRPDRRGEIVEMRQQFQSELAALKKTNLGGGGMAALYSLPWYMIIGPPGSGKSTALRNSGLSFPSRRGNVRGIGGTRHCDWWLANEAVILDTAGRYAVEQDDRDEWLSFLDILRKHRSKKPVNGVIVAVSVTDLGGRSEEEIEDLSQRLRERVDEITTRLQMVVPVYLIFTKCDLVPGFIEVFGGMRKEERGQILGCTFPIEGQQDGVAGERFDAAFDELTSSIRQRVYAGLDAERRIDARALMYQFPQQLAALRGAGLQLVSGLFAGDVYSEPPILRGVYFTSGTQEGRPVDLLAAKVAEAFGVNSGEAAAPVAAKSYFLRDVFARVMFPDKDVAVRSAKGKQEMLLGRIAIGGAALLSALLLAFLPLGAYRQNVAVVDSTATIVKEVLADRERHKNSLVPPSVLESLRVRLGELKQWEADAPPLAMRYGMYQGGTIFPHLRRFYIQTLQRELFSPLVLQDANEMRSLRQVYDFNTRLSDEEYARYFDKLKMHLLLTVPRHESEPVVEGDVMRWLTEKASTRWAGALGVDTDPRTRTAMEANVKFYLELLQADPTLAIVRDGGAVTDTRALLSRVPYTEAVVKQVVAETAGAERELNIRRIMGGEATPIVSDRSVRIRPAFTRWGFESSVRERLRAQGVKSDAWVLGIKQLERNDAEAFLAELRSAYFAQYIEEWRVFLESLRISQPADLGDALRMLTELSRGQPPPLQRLMQTVDYNTQLQEKQSALAGAASKAGAGIIAKVKKKLGKKKAGAIDGAAAAGQGALQQRLDGPHELFAAEDVAAEFSDFVRFGVPPPPPAAAGADPNAPATIPAGTKVPLDTFQEQIAFLRDALQTHLDNPQESSQLLKQLQSTRTAVQSLLGQLDASAVWRPRLEALTWPVIQHVSESLVGIKADTGRKWCSEVISVFNRTLARRYPFAASQNDAVVSDVAEFFKPRSGVLWGFYGRELAADLLKVGSSYRFDERLGGIVRRSYNEGLAGYMQRAQATSNALFANGDELRMEFDVIVTPSPAYGLIALEVGGEVAAYRGGPEQWEHLSWPAGDAAQGARLRVRARGGVEDTIHYNGYWGLFRLMEAGKLVGQGRGTSFTLSWSLPRVKEPVQVEFRPAAAQSSFFVVRRRGNGHGIAIKLGDLEPPDAITKGSPPCVVTD